MQKLRQNDAGLQIGGVLNKEPIQLTRNAPMKKSAPFYFQDQMKRISLISLLVMLLSACMVTKSEPSFYGQVTFIEKSSWLTRKVDRFDEDGATREPIRISRKVHVIKDSITELSFKHNQGRIKRHIVHGRFYLDKISADTTKMLVKNNSLIYSDFQLVGMFLPPANAIKSARYSEKGIVFYEDGSCFHSWATTCSDSPCGSEYQRLGEYKVFNDTIYTVYFLGRNYSSSMNQSANTIKSIDEALWRVTEPYTVNYVLSGKNDTLHKFYDSREQVIESYLVAADTIKFIPTKTGIMQ